MLDVNLRKPDLKIGPPVHSKPEVVYGFNNEKTGAIPRELRPYWPGRYIKGESV